MEHTELTTNITSLEQVIAISKKHAAGDEVPVEVLKACVDFLREERKTPTAKKQTAKDKVKSKTVKPTLSLDDIF